MKLAILIVSHQPERPLLLLDEPDNHLDLDSKILLAQALCNYRGGFILVSHDHDFGRESGIQVQVTRYPPYLLVLRLCQTMFACP